MALHWSERVRACRVYSRKQCRGHTYQMGFKPRQYYSTWSLRGTRAPPRAWSSLSAEERGPAGSLLETFICTQTPVCLPKTTARIPKTLRIQRGGQNAIQSHRCSLKADLEIHANGCKWRCSPGREAGLTFWAWLSCSCFCGSIPHCTHCTGHITLTESITSGWAQVHTSVMLTMLLPRSAMAFPNFSAYKRPAHPSRPRSDTSYLALSQHALYLLPSLPPTEVERNHSNLLVPIIVLYTSAGALITLYWEWRVEISPATLARGPYLCSLNFQQSLWCLAQRGFNKMFAESKTIAKTASVPFPFTSVWAYLHLNKTTILVGF